MASKKATPKKRSARKPTAPAVPRGSKKKPKKKKKSQVFFYDTGPLTPQYYRSNANCEPVANFAGLDKGYWNLLRNIYHVVVVKVTRVRETLLEFKFVNPSTGALWPTVSSIDLDDGDNVYPYFPSTAQWADINLKPYGYLLLSYEYLVAQLGAGNVDDYASSKRPSVASL